MFQYWKVVNKTKHYTKRPHLDLTFPLCYGKPTNSVGIVKYCWDALGQVVTRLWLRIHA